MTEEEEESITQLSRQILVLGVDAQEIPGGTPEANHVLAFCQASFRMTLSRVGFLTLAPGSKGIGVKQ